MHRRFSLERSFQTIKLHMHVQWSAALRPRTIPLLQLRGRQDFATVRLPLTLTKVLRSSASET